MKHQKQGKKFNREKGQRKAFERSLMENLILHGSIKTTEARAKMLKTKAEKMMTLAKKQDLASLRLLIARLSKKPALRLFYDLAPQHKDRKGGYIRVIKLSQRRLGDAASCAHVEFVS